MTEKQERIQKIAEELAETKAEVKYLETEVKRLQSELLAGDAPQKIVTEFGHLIMSTRATYKCVDIEAARKEMGPLDFMNACSLSYAAVKKACGVPMAEAMLDVDIFKVSSTSKFYSLK